jgi:hypothetical protein
MFTVPEIPNSTAATFKGTGAWDGLFLSVRPVKDEKVRFCFFEKCMIGWGLTPGQVFLLFSEVGVNNGSGWLKNWDPS